MPSEIAAQLFTLREYLQNPLDIANTLMRVKAMGYNAVQLSAVGPIEPSALAEILEREALQAVITHTAFDRLVNDLPAVIAEHKLWHCPNVAIGGLPGEYRNREGYVRFAGLATEIARKLADAGLTFSYHNHAFEFERYDGKTGMELLFDHADPTLFNAEIDTYWVQYGGGDPAAWISRMTNRLIVVHLKDMAIVENEIVMAEVGEGNLNWPRILAACREAGVRWYAVEQDVCRRDPFDSLAISLRNLLAMGLQA